MKYCSRCKINVDGKQTHCPLCFRELSEITNGESERKTPIFIERTKNENFTSNTSFLTKFFVFTSICIVTVCALLNAMLTPEIHWAVLVFACVVYLWVLIAHTIISRRSVFEKFLFEILALLFILVASEDVSQDKFWVQSYVFPSIAMGAELVVLMITFIRKDKSWILSFASISILLLISNVLNLIYLDKYYILSIISIIFSSLSILGYFIFGFNQIKQEFSKKFHL